MSLALVLALALGAPEPALNVPALEAAPAESADGPVSTAPTAPKPSPASLTSPPADDYGYVAWCSGAVRDYLSLYDRVMPEVTRIETAFPGPDGLEADLKVYPQLKAQAEADIEQFDAALAAADRASAHPLTAAREDGARRGRAIWTGAALSARARLAQTWMSWSPPNDCDLAAKRLVIRSGLLGVALKSNPSAPAPAPEEPQQATSAAADPIADPIADLAAAAQATATSETTASSIGLKGPQ